MSGRALPNSPADFSVMEAADALGARKLSARELAQAVIDRRSATEPLLHAHVVERTDALLAEAELADLHLKVSESPNRWVGIPIVVKDIFDLDGEQTRCGSRARADVAPATRDAVSVRRLRDAGAIVTGKTVTQEFAAGVVSPPARNGWDPDRIPGGSSGGSAVAVSTGTALAAFGSDTGGSIRIPASVCGVVGLKPTYGTVSTEGVFPLAWSLDTVGPLARTVADAALFFDTIRERDCPPSSGQIGQSIKGLRIGLPRSFFLDRVQDDVATRVEEAVALLRSLGAEVIEASWDAASYSRAASFVINRVETVSVHGRDVRTHPDLYGAELRLRIEASTLFPAERYVQAQRARAVLRGSMAAYFNEHRLDAIVMPSTPGTAVPADDLHVCYGDGSREHVSSAFTRLTMPCNLTGQPAISVPCGFDRDGLPVGLQIAGRPFEEAMVCRVAHAYEREAGWWQHRPATITKTDQDRKA